MFAALCEVFDRADITRDGTISIAEYMALCEARGTSRKCLYFPCSIQRGRDRVNARCSPVLSGVRRAPGRGWRPGHPGPGGQGRGDPQGRLHPPHQELTTPEALRDSGPLQSDTLEEESWPGFQVGHFFFWAFVTLFWTQCWGKGQEI